MFAWGRYLFFPSAPLYDIPRHVSSDANDNQTSHGDQQILGFRADQSTHKHMYRKARYEQRTDRGNQIDQYFNNHGFDSDFCVITGFFISTITPPSCKATVSALPAPIVARFRDSELFTGS